MRIWEVTVNTEMVRTYFFPTKKEADAFASTSREELEAEGHDNPDVEIVPWDVKPTRKGIAQALNGLIEVGCFNEG